MRVKSQHKIPVMPVIQCPQSRRRQEIPDINVRQIVTGPEKVSIGFDEVIVALERSDSFLQRLSAINVQIERQLIIKTIQ